MATGDKEFPFTKAKINELAIPKSGERARYYDTKSKGLCLRVSSGGSKTFIYFRRIDRKLYSKKLGEFPACTIEQARLRVDDINGAIARGQNPFAELIKEKEEFSLGELFDAYIEQYAKNRCTTWKDMISSFNRYFRDWRDRKLSSFTRIEIQTRINRLCQNGKRKHTANRNHDLIRAVFAWGISKNLFAGVNPCVGIDKFQVQPRERFLKPDEFKAFFEALDVDTSDDFRDYVLLSLFTGARQSNVLSMRWQDLDLKIGQWRIPKTKNKESHTVPLTPLAIEILAQRTKGENDTYVFSSDGATGHYVEPKTSWRKLLKRAGLQDLRMHDLRRTAGSYMAMNNQSLPIIGKALGHKSQASTQIYARLVLDPVRAAMVQAQEAMVKAGRALSGDEP